MTAAAKRCEFCALGEHDIEECGLLQRMRNVARFDRDTRQLMWSICEYHDYWSTDSAAECGLCELELEAQGRS